MKVLLLCASHNDLGLIRGLKKLCCQIIVTGNIPNLIGQRLCDKYIKADYSDKDLILQIAKNEGVERVCACCNDYGVYTAAFVAEKLGFPCYDSYKTTVQLHNKDAFRSFCVEHKIPAPNYASFNTQEKAMQYIKTVHLPVIIKPIDASAGNGISKVEQLAQAQDAIQNAFLKARDKRIVIEEFLTGSQHGLCTYLQKEKVVAVSSNNEYSIINPYRVEIDTFPATNYEKEGQPLIQEIEKIAHILHLKDGIFHLQYIATKEGSKIIEVMRRAIGNMYGVPASLLCGFDWDYWEARARLGINCDNFPKPIIPEGHFAYKAILASKNGKIHSINIPKEYDKYLLGQCLIKPSGCTIENYTKEPVGLLFFSFPSWQKAKEILLDNYRKDLVTMQ